MAGEEFSDENFSFDDELSELRQKRLQEMENEFFSRQNNEKCGISVVDEYTFLDFIKNNKYAVIDMWAEWCGPCRMVAPVIEELSREFSGVVSFGKCNTDENQNIAKNLSISSIPTLLFFSGGRLSDRLTGAYPKEAIKNRISSVFQL